MSNLKLVTTERFGEIDCDFYRNMNDDMFLTREQIDTALGYADPIKAIQKIHLNHKERLDGMSIKVKAPTTPKTGVCDNLMTETTYYTERGIMEICRWSRQPKADQFMDWCYDIVQKYRKNELITKEALVPLTEAVTKLVTEVAFIQEEIGGKKDKQPQEPTYRKPYNPWFAKMSPKYKLLEDYYSNLNGNFTRGTLYRNILEELENEYDLDTQQIQSDYCYEHNTTSCYPLEPYEFVPKYRKMIEKIVNDHIVSLNLASEDDPIVSTKHATIFNTSIAIQG